MKLMLVRLKVNEVVLHPRMSLPKDTEDAEPGQMLGREVHCGLLNRQQQEILLVKNSLNIRESVTYDCLVLIIP